MAQVSAANDFDILNITALISEYICTHLHSCSQRWNCSATYWIAVWMKWGTEEEK